MTVLEFYHYLHIASIGETMHILNGSAYDHNINVNDDVYVMKDGMKDFFIKDNSFYVRNNYLEEDVKFNSLHFQGGAKWRIKQIGDMLNAI